jgi:hypothetical protein
MLTKCDDNDDAWFPWKLQLGQSANLHGAQHTGPPVASAFAAHRVAAEGGSLCISLRNTEAHLEQSAGKHAADSSAQGVVHEGAALRRGRAYTLHRSLVRRALTKDQTGGSCATKKEACNPAAIRFMAVECCAFKSCRPRIHKMRGKVVCDDQHKTNRFSVVKLKHFTSAASPPDNTLVNSLSPPPRVCPSSLELVSILFKTRLDVYWPCSA